MGFVAGKLGGGVGWGGVTVAGGVYAVLHVWVDLGAKRYRVHDLHEWSPSSHPPRIYSQSRDLKVKEVRGLRVLAREM